MNGTSSGHLGTVTEIIWQQENFWTSPRQSTLRDLLRHSLLLGFFPFAGYLVNYTIRGTIWNVWPFVQTTLDVASGIIFAGLQWIFFAIFPFLSSLILDLIRSRPATAPEFEESVMISTYSQTPLCLALLFVGVPYFDRVLTILGFGAYIFLLYNGFRLIFHYTIVRSLSVAFLYFLLFALIRQMFVYAIGF